jgi:hypothetical protein
VLATVILIINCGQHYQWLVTKLRIMRKTFIEDEDENDSIQARQK